MEQTNPLPNIPEPIEIPVSPPINSSSLKKPFLIVLFVVFLLILSSLGTYFFVKSQTVSSTPVVSPTPTVSASLIPSTTDETANWKTYTNELFNYEVKYPIDWTVKNMGPDSGGGEASSNNSFVGIIKQGYENNYPLYHMSIEPVKNLLVDNVEKDEEKAYQNWISTYRGYSLEGMIESQKTVNNITMNIIEGITQYGGKVTISLYEKIYLFKTADRKSVIAVLTWSSNKNESEIFDQILSTFKFN